MDSVGSAQKDDDFLLMRRVSERDEAALRALYQRHSGMVFGMCLRILRDRGEAEQVLIDVFAEVWQQASRFDSTRGSTAGYLALLARSRSIDNARSRKSANRTQALRPQDRDLGDAGRSLREVVQPIDSTLAHERDKMIVAALDSLGEHQRVAVEMAFYQGLSHSEIAAKLDRPIGTVSGASPLLPQL